MKSVASSRLRHLPSAAIVAAVLAALGTQSAHAGNTWTGGGASTNWTDANNWGGSAPVFGTLTFTTGGTQGTTSVLNGNFTSSGSTNMSQLLWTGSSAWTLNSSNSAVISLFDNSGVQSKVENQSTGLVTINAPITFAATAGAAWGEINAVNGDLTFGTGTLTVNGSQVAGIRLFGGGRTTTFNNTVSASGKYFATTSANTTVAIGGAFTSGDFYLMNGGTLKLNTGGTLTTSGSGFPALRLGGDFGTTGSQNLTSGATFQLTPLTGGLTVNALINTVASNTSGALLIDSLNTSGTNTLAGDFYLDSNLRVNQASGGTIVISDATTDIKGQTLTLTGTGGNVNLTGVVGNSIGSGQVVVGVDGTAGGPTVNMSQANTYSGDTFVRAGTLAFTSTGSAASSAIRLGSTSGTSVDAAINLTTLTGGTTISSTINPVTTSGSGTITINSQNTSGTNNLSGLIALDRALTITQASGGSLTFSGGSFDIKDKTLTVSSAGTTTINEVLGSSLTAGGSLVKTGTGTLILQGVANNYTGTSAGTLNANGTQINQGILGIYGDLSLGVAPTGAYNNIQFTGSATLQDTSTNITLNANRNISIASGATATFDSNGNTFTIGGIISGSTGAVTKTGTGTLTLTGANTYAGTTTVNGGELRVDFNAAGATTSNIINNSANSSALSMGGGTFRALVRAGGNDTQRFNGLSVTAGANSIVTDNYSNTSRSIAISLGAITRTVGSTATFTGPNGSFTTTNGITTTTGNTLGIIGGWAVMGSASWATSNSTVLGSLPAGSYTTTATAGTTAATYADANIDVTTSPTLTGAGVITPNTLRFNTVGGSTLTLDAGDNIIKSGGILVTSTVGANVSTITGGNLLGASGADLIIHQNNGTTSANGLTISSLIKDNTGATALTKSGAGLLTLTNANTYTGNTYVNAGTLQLNNNLALQNSALDTSRAGVVTLLSSVTTPTIGGLTGSTALASVITTNYSGVTTLTLNPGTGVSNTYSGIIANGASGMNFLKTGAGTQILSGANTYTGTSTIRNGTVSVGVSDVASTSGAFGNAASNILLTDASSGASDNVSLLINGAFTLNRNITVQNNATSGTTTIGASSSSTSTFGGTLTLNKDVTLGSSIANGKAVFSNIISSPGTVAIRINNAATSTSNGVEWTQTANNTYTGSVSVDAGVLRLNGSGAATALIPGNVTIGGGATAAYLRNVSANNISDTSTVTVNDRGTFEMAASAVGNEKIGSLILNAGANGANVNTTSSTLTLSATSVATDVLTMTGGTINIGSSAGSAGTLRLNGNVSVIGSSAAATINTISTTASTIDLANLGIATRTFNVAAGSGAALNQELQISAVLSDGGNAGSVLKSGNGTMILSGANTFTGVTTIGAGTLSVGTIGNGGAAGNLGQATNVAANLVFDGGTLKYTGSTATSDRAFTINANKTATIDTANGISFAGATGTATNGALTKLGVGTLTLTGTNTYTGNTTISAGTLSMATNLIASSPNIFIGNGATLNGSTSFIMASNQTLTGTGATGTFSGGNATGLTMNGNNTVSNNASGQLSLTRLNVLGTGNVISAGDIQSGGSGTSQRGLAIANGSSGTLTITGGSLTTNGNATNNDVLGASSNTGIGNLIINGGSYTANSSAGLNIGGGAGSGTLTLTTGSVTLPNLTLSAVSGFTNAVVNLDGGTFTLGNLTVTSGLANKINFNGGTFKASADQTLGDGAVAVALNVKNGGAIIDTNGKTVTISNPLLNFGGTSTGGLTKQNTGTLTLSGASTYTGSTTVNAGTLLINTGGSIGNTSRITVASGATIQNNNGAAITGALTLTEGSSLNTNAAGSSFTTSNGLELVGSLSDGWSAIALTNTAGSGLIKGGALTFTLTGITAGTYDLDGASAGFSGSFTSAFVGANALTTADSGATFTGSNIGGFDYSFTNSTNTLTITAVPEPSTWIGAGLITSLVAWSQRKRFAKIGQRAA